MTKTLNAGAQDVRKYTEGPITEVDYIQVEYGHFEECIDWLNSTKLTPRSTDQPDISPNITFKNGAAAFDRGVEPEEAAKKVIGSTEVQDKARVGRNDYRKVLGIEYVRELILK